MPLVRHLNIADTISPDSGPDPRARAGGMPMTAQERRSETLSRFGQMRSNIGHGHANLGNRGLYP